MAATVGRIVLLVTGGYAGSALYTYRDNLPQFFGSTLRDLGNLLKMQNTGNSNSGLEKQVEMLSQDMRALMVSGRNAGTIVLSSSQGSIFSKVILIMIPGAGYLWYKGFRFSDLQWVSRNSFQQAISAMSTAQTRLDKFVSEFRDAVQKKLAEFQSNVSTMFGAVEKQIDEKVGDVRVGVAGAQMTLDGLDTRVQRLEGKLDESNNSIQYANRGIQLLCSVVAESVSGSSRSVKQLQDFAQSSPASLEAPPAVPLLGGPAQPRQEPQPAPAPAPAPSYPPPAGLAGTMGLMLGGATIGMGPMQIGAAFRPGPGPVKGAELRDGTSNPPFPVEGK